MDEATGHGDAYAPPELYTEVQQFYARQMNLIEGRETDPDAWAETFTDDAVFASAHEEPVVGRDAIRASIRQGVAHIASQGLDFRHWFGMLDVIPRADGGLDTRYYALAMATPRGGQLAFRGSHLCRDQLVRSADGVLRVRRRSLWADGRDTGEKPDETVEA